MIGLDTNVLVRYIMQDDARQSAKASKLIESLSAEEPGFFTLVSVVELGWVLSTSYELKRTQIVQVFDSLLQTKEIVIEKAEQLRRALYIFSTANADLADCLIERASNEAGCKRTMTFDKAAAKLAGMTLIV
jgi:predicted nucleic-acid-binding protein